MAALKKLVRKILNVSCFIVIVIALGRTLPKPEEYISYDLVTQLGGFIFGEVTADSIFDTYSIIDWSIMLAIAGIIFSVIDKLVCVISRKARGC